MNIKANYSRRDLLKAGLTAGAVSALPSFALGKPKEAELDPNPKADVMILLWMAGGQAQSETWDIKKYTPFEAGMEAKAVYSTFKSIPTSVDGLQISEALPHCAKIMHHGTMIRSFRPGDLGAILHSRHQYHFHTCYRSEERRVGKEHR